MTMRWEVPIGAVDGLNDTFRTAVPYRTGTVRHALNGQFKAPGHTADGLVELGGDEFRLKTAPASTDTIEVVYDDGGVLEAARSIVVTMSTTMLELGPADRAKTVPLVTGDRKPRLDFHWVDSAGRNLDLTDRRPHIRFRREGDPVVLNSPTALALDNAVAGQCHYDLPPGLLACSGLLEAELSLEFGSGVRQTLPELLRFWVRRSF